MVTELSRFQSYVLALDTGDYDTFVEAAQDMWLVTRLAQVLNKEEAAQALDSIDIWEEGPYDSLPF